MIYKGNFSDKNNNVYSVELITAAGDSEKKILLSNTPVTVSYEGSEDIFKPLKLSGATVRCWVNEYMFDLFTGEAKGVRCMIKKDNLIQWQGYVSPNIYNQDYNKEKFELEIEAVDCLSVLDYIKYESESKEITSFLDIIKMAINASGGEFKYLYYPKTTDISLETTFISEQNWFNEDAQAMTYKEILESVMQYLNLTMFQYKDSVYMVDYRFFNTSTLYYTRYTIPDYKA
ncbi:MAG: hypothetical protein RR397_09305 [Odoribacter sp.]